MNKITKFIISVFVSHLAGIIGSIFTVSSIDSWYALINKPVFSPPNWIFGPVWLTLYTLMGIALYIVWNKGLDNKSNRLFFNVFMVHLFFNAMWSITFFGLQDIFGALLVILILWSLIFYLIRLGYKINRKVAWLLAPYILWVSFATILNFSLYLIN